VGAPSRLASGVTLFPSSLQPFCQDFSHSRAASRLQPPRARIEAIRYTSLLFKEDEVAGMMEATREGDGGGAPTSSSSANPVAPPPILFLDATAAASGGLQSRTVKRPRPVKSCLECRKRKLKCDRQPVCSQCQKSQRMCKYSDPENGITSDGSDAETAERPVKRAQRASTASFHVQQDSPVAGRHAVHVNGIEPSPARSAAATMEEMAARLERLEKLLMERESPADSNASRQHHQQHCPQVHLHPPQPQRLVASPMTIRSLSVKGGLRTRIFGQNSTKVLLNLFDDARDFMMNMAKTEGMRELFSGLQNVYKALQKEHHKALEPITVFVDSMMPVQKRMADILPKKPVCDRLLEAYIGMSEGLYRFMHIPSFRKEYEQYWDGKAYHDAFLPRLLCMMSIASRYESESRGLGHDKTNSVHTPTACALVRHWLDGLKGKQLVDVNTLQTEILLLHAQRQIALRQQDSWTQLGFILRMAMTMGLHRDPSEFPQLTPFFGELRRKLWYTVMDMDLHVALACNLPCAVREGEFSCKPPRNLNDEDLFPEMQELPESKPLDQYTISQLQAYAASTIPWRLKVSSILSRLDGVHDYVEVLEVGNKLERMLDDIACLFPRHAALDAQRKYKQWRDRALLDMHVRRPLSSVCAELLWLSA
jgi:hypothetical protein